MSLISLSPWPLCDTIKINVSDYSLTGKPLCNTIKMTFLISLPARSPCDYYSQNYQNERFWLDHLASVQLVRRKLQGISKSFGQGQS